MRFSTELQGRDDELVELFTATFTASEGEEEGALIGGLVRGLLSDTAEQDLVVIVAEENGRLIGGILASRLLYEQDKRTLFILAPVAVATAQQRKGVGQRLLTHALAALRRARVDVVMTYGDPNFYSKVGFRPISEADARAPFALSHPEGWLALSLTDQPVTPLEGPSRCVAALSDPVFW